jgi:hypothetical protein
MTSKDLITALAATLSVADLEALVDRARRAPPKPKGRVIGLSTAPHRALLDEGEVPCEPAIDPRTGKRAGRNRIDRPLKKGARGSA